MDQQKSCSLKLAPKKARKRRAHVFQFNLFLCAIFHILFYIMHNYVIPQAVPHAIPQTHSSFYPRLFFSSTAGQGVEALNDRRS